MPPVGWSDEGCSSAQASAGMARDYPQNAHNPPQYPQNKYKRILSFTRRTHEVAYEMFKKNISFTHKADTRGHVDFGSKPSKFMEIPPKIKTR